MRYAHNDIEAESPCLACEIERLQAENAALTEIVKEYVLQHDAMSDNWAAVEDAPPEPCPCPLCERARAALAPKEDEGG